MSEWKKVKIGDFLKRKKEPIEIKSNEKYKLLTVRLYHKGVELRCEKLGSEIQSKMYKVSKGDFILSGIDARNGAFGIVPNELDEAVVTNDFWYFEIDESVVKKDFFFWVTKTPIFLDVCRKASMGETQRIRLQKDLFFNYEINCPAIDFQENFVNQMNLMICKIDRLQEEIEKQKSYAKQLRQNILQEAIEGKLTADWRKQHPVQKGNPDYDAEALFEQIQNEKYHADLFAPNGAHAKKAKSVSSEPIRVTRKEKSLPPITKDEIPFEIPAGWKWVRLGDISLFSSAGKSFNCESREAIGDEWGIIKTSAITSGVFIESENKFYSKKCNNDVQTKIQMGDFLFCRASGSKGLAGRSCVVEKISSNLLLSDKSIRIELAQGINKSLVNMLNNSQHGENYRLSLGTNKSTSMNNLTREQILNFRIPLPPLAEQKEIVSRVEQHIQTITQLETQIATRETLTKQLMQSILKDAFEKE